MSNTLHLTILSIVLAVTYGVAFSFAYPKIEIDGQLGALFALFGVVTALLITGLCRLIFGGQSKKSAP
jgi:hypothetical protein